MGDSLALAGAVQQLVAILRREFAAVGNPPIERCWRYRSAIPLWKNNTLNEKALKGLLMLGFWNRSAALRFSALVSDAHLPNSIRLELSRVIAETPPLTETVTAMKRVKGLLDVANGLAPRLQHLFDTLCERQWTQNLNVSLTVENGAFLRDKQRVGNSLLPVDEQLLRDLLDAADEATARVGQHGLITGPEPPDDSAFVPAGKLDWRKQLDTLDYKRLRAFLAANPNIRTRKPSKYRLEIHAGDWARHWAVKADAELNPADAQVADTLALSDPVAKRAADIRRQK